MAALICLILAAIFAGLAAIAVPPSTSRIGWLHFGWLAVMLLAVAMLLGGPGAIR